MIASLAALLATFVLLLLGMLIVAEITWDWPDGPQVHRPIPIGAFRRRVGRYDPVAERWARAQLARIHATIAAEEAAAASATVRQPVYRWYRPDVMGQPERELVSVA